MAGPACALPGNSSRWNPSQIMPRFAANLTYLFTELPMLDRFAAAAEAGFGAVEILYPYDMDPRALFQAAQSAGLEIVLMNCPPPNWSGGPRGFAAIPGLESRFRSDFDRALRLAQALHIRHIRIIPGAAQGRHARRTLIENLTWAAARAPHANLVMKPVSPTILPGSYLCDFGLAAEIIAQVGAGNLGLQLDSFHAQDMTGSVLGVWREHASLIRHVQIAGHPHRHEPAVDDPEFLALFQDMDSQDFQGWVSARYNPSARTDLGLGWLDNATRR